MVNSSRRTFLGIPSYGGVEGQTALAIAGAGIEERITVHAVNMSLLARCFNTLWCAALNAREAKGITHFAMLHADIIPQQGFLTKLLDGLEQTGADIFGAVVAIKDQTGRTSSALIDQETEVCRNLMVDELPDLPTRFTSADFSGNQILLANTGLWVCDLRRPWVEEVWFEIRDWIERDEEGQFVPHSLSEDWNFSVQAHRLGAKIVLTQEIELEHMGRMGFKLPTREVALAAV